MFRQRMREVKKSVLKMLDLCMLSQIFMWLITEKQTTTNTWNTEHSLQTQVLTLASNHMKIPVPLRTKHFHFKGCYIFVFLSPHSSYAEWLKFKYNLTVGENIQTQNKTWPPEALCSSSFLPDIYTDLTGLHIHILQLKVYGQLRV